MIWTENKKPLTIQFDIMRADEIVGAGEVKLALSSARFQNFKIFNTQSLPYSVSFKNISFPDYLALRCLPMTNHRNIYFVRLAIHGETRNKMMPFLLSLSTNSVSLADKYWLNPKETIDFVVNGANIVFEKKDWHDIDPFLNLYAPGELDQYGLCDQFFIEKTRELDARSLIWSLAGAQNKRWELDEDGYYLEKKLRKKAFENELETLDFFLSNGIVAPKYTYYIKKLSDMDQEYARLYDGETIQDGLHVIQKRCLTDSNSYLVNLIDYVDNDNNIATPINRMFSIHNVSAIETEQFINTLKAYQSKFDVEDILLDTRNMGLLVDKSGAHPVVWGRLIRRMMFGQFCE